MPRPTQSQGYVLTFTALIMVLGGGYLCCSQKDWAVGGLNLVSGAGLMVYEKRQRR